MTTYSSLRVNDLRELLSKRKLPTNGKKEDLIARLEASDRDADQAIPAPVADPTAHLPSAEEYEINWDEDDTAATGAKSTKSASAKPEVTKVVATSSSGAVTTATVGTGESKTEEQASKDGKKPFTFKRLAEQFTDLPSTKKPDNKKVKSEKPKEAPVAAAVEVKADEAPAKPEAEVEPAAPEPTFAAGLAPTPLEAELEKRKARAARFGAEQTDRNAAESLKKLERAARFGGGGGTAADVEPTVGVMGLDQALPERKGKRAGEHGSSGGRGGVQKRTRFGDRQRRHGGGVGGGDRRNGGASNQQKKVGGAPTAKSVLDDPAEREKAEKRKNRFGNAA